MVRRQQQGKTAMTVTESIQRKIRDGLGPEDLLVENESARHAGHAGSPGNGESHFRLRIVSNRFRGLSRLARHRLVYDLLKAELDGPVHALALETLTPEEAGN